MGLTTDRMPRPLTGAERERIIAATAHFEALQAAADAAGAARDEAILAAFNARAQVTEIAQAAGISRNSVYAAVRRAEDAMEAAMHAPLGKMLEQVRAQLDAVEKDARRAT